MKKLRFVCFLPVSERDGGEGEKKCMQALKVQYMWLSILRALSRVPPPRTSAEERSHFRLTITDQSEAVFYVLDNLVLNVYLDFHFSQHLIGYLQDNEPMLIGFY